MHALIYFPDYRASNPYQDLLYERLDPMAEVMPGTIASARQRLERSRPDRRVLFHLHWEDAVLKPAVDAADAKTRAQRFLDEAERFISQGGLLVWTKHNLAPHDFAHATLSEDMAMVLGQLAHAVIVHAPQAAALVANRYRIPAEKLCLQIHGHYRTVYPPANRDAARWSFGLTPDQYCVLHFGRLTPYKGGQDLIDAAARLQDPRLHLLIAGKQPFAKLAIPPELGARTTVVDRYIPLEEIGQYFAAADVVALPYRDILTSGSLLLALGFERPVIMPALASLAEIAADAVGFSYQPAQADGLLEALRAALSADPAELDQAGRRGGRLAAAYDWRIAGRQLSDCLHGLIARFPCQDRRLPGWHEAAPAAALPLEHLQSQDHAAE